MKLELDNEIKLPTWALYALANSHYSELSDDENKALEYFEKRYPVDKYVIDYGQDEYFSYDNFLDRFGSDVIDCKIYKMIEVLVNEKN